MHDHTRVLLFIPDNITKFSSGKMTIILHFSTLSFNLLSDSGKVLNLKLAVQVYIYIERDRYCVCSVFDDLMVFALSLVR